MSFEDLGLIEPISRALVTLGYETPTPIQKQAIPVVLEGRDLLGSAQTGTGKTAAFAIPILQRLHEDKLGPFPKGEYPVRAIVLVPTRELALQVGESFATYGKHTKVRRTVVYGGVHQRTQVKALRGKIDVIVATPGRLLDLMTQGHVRLENIQYLVLDEADRMLDMGFIDDIKLILNKIPKERQSLFFSATMPKSIVSLSKQIVTNPVKVAVDPGLSPAETVKQTVYFVGRRTKTNLLVQLLTDGTIGSALVFSRTRRGADKITNELRQTGIDAQVIHGERSQRDRQRALKLFKDEKCQVLVATDIAARGIDIDELTHVVNYDLPETVEAYVHRIGRTGRAGLEGAALSFCDSDEAPLLWRIQRDLKKTLDVENDHPYALSAAQFAEPKFGKNKKPNYAGKGKWKKNAGSGKPKRRPSGKPGKPSGKPGKASGKPGKPGAGKSAKPKRKPTKQGSATPTEEKKSSPPRKRKAKKLNVKTAGENRPKKKKGADSKTAGRGKAKPSPKRDASKAKPKDGKKTSEDAKSTPKSKAKHSKRKNKTKGAPGTHKKKKTTVAPKVKAKPSSKKAKLRKAKTKKKVAKKKSKKKT